jgi:hypothetical protein
MGDSEPFRMTGQRRALLTSCGLGLVQRLSKTRFFFLLRMMAFTKIVQRVFRQNRFGSLMSLHLKNVFFMT